MFAPVVFSRVGYARGEHLIDALLHVDFGLTHKYYTSLERAATDTLPYLSLLSVTKKKVFVTMTTRVNVIQPFSLQLTKRSNK